MNKLKILEEKIDDIKRIRMLSKEKVLFKPYTPSNIDRRILAEFGDTSADKLAKELGVNRSYVYSIIRRYEFIFAKGELNE